MYRLRTLGTLDLRDPAGNPVTGLLQQPSRLGLLIYLAAARGDGFLRRDHLLPLFWPELDETRGRAALSQALHVIRRAHGQGVIVTRGTEELRLDRDLIWADVHQFMEATDASSWEAADRLYTGEFLPSFHLSDAPEFEQWLETTRGVLRERARTGAIRLAGKATTDGRLEEAVHWARRAVALAPLDEAATHRLMEALAASGDRAAAVQAYEEFAEMLDRELQLSPLPETRALLEKLRVASSPVRSQSQPVDSPSIESRVEPPRISPLEKPRSRLRLAGLTLLALLLPVTGLFFLGAGVHRASGRQYPRVAVFPFVVRGDTVLSYLSEGMVELVSTKLEAIGPVRTVDPGTLLTRINRIPGGAGQDDPRALAQLAAELDADLFVVGRIVSLGPGVSLSLSLYDRKGERQTIVSTDAPADTALPAAVDRAVTELAASRWSAPAERLERLAIGSTKVQPALKAYLEGARLFRAGDYGRARDAFHTAIENDSLYAIAWYRLSTTAGWLGDNDDYLRGARRAGELSHRLSDRDRRLVQAHRAYVDGRVEESEDLYRGLVAEYPDDAEAWYQLGEVLFHTSAQRGRPIEAAAPAFAHAEELIGGSSEAIGHLVQLAVLDHDETAADSLLDRLLPLYPPGEPRRIYNRLLVAVLHDNKGPRRAILSELHQANGTTLWIAAQAVATYTNDFETADTLLTWLSQPGYSTSYRVLALGLKLELRLAAGRWAEARQLTRRIAELDPATASEWLAACDAFPGVVLDSLETKQARLALQQWGRPPGGVAGVDSPEGWPQLHAALRDYYIGLLDLAAGDSVALAGALGRLDQAEERSENLRHAGLAENLRAAKALRAGQHELALSTLEQLAGPDRKGLSLPGLTPADERFRRAGILTALHRNADALGYYRSFRVIFEGDLRFRGLGLLNEAKTLEALGQPAQARDAYQTFLDVWSGSDPRFEPMLKVARARAAELGRTEVR